jgi:hypothetical protein
VIVCFLGVEMFCEIIRPSLLMIILILDQYSLPTIPSIDPTQILHCYKATLTLALLLLY